MNDTDARRALRRELRAARASLDPRQRMAAAQALADRLEALPEFLIDQRVAVYWAVDGEISLHAAVTALRRRGQGLFLPVLRGERELAFAPYARDAALEPNRHGIPEPSCAPTELLPPQALQLVLVPLLGFDRHGNRLGFGAGYYDRSFAFLRAGERPREPLLVGVAYACQERAQLDAAAWDVPLDFVATETELIDCHAHRAAALP